MSIIEIHSTPTYQSLSHKSKDELICRLLLSYETEKRLEHRIVELENGIREFCKTPFAVTVVIDNKQHCTPVNWGGNPAFKSLRELIKE